MFSVPLLSICRLSSASSSTSSASATLRAISLWMAKTFSTPFSKVLAHRFSSLAPFVSWTETRSFLPAFLTVPSRMVSTSSSRAIWLTLSLVPLYLTTEGLAITPRFAMLDRVVISSSVIPSAKYSSLLSGLRFSRGRTARRCLCLETCPAGRLSSQGSATL